MRDGYRAFSSLRSRTGRAIAKALLSRVILCNPVPAARSISVSRRPHFSFGFVLLSAPRERANTNFKNEDKMKTCTTKNNSHKRETSRQDIYTRVTERIVADLDQGVRPWAILRNAESAAGKITPPFRHNAPPYSDIHILML